jgi:hypothetical protein
MVRTPSPSGYGVRRVQLDTLSGQDHDAATMSRGAIMDIVVWLRSLGLEKYEAVFRENEIDPSRSTSISQIRAAKPVTVSLAMA